MTGLVISGCAQEQVPEATLAPTKSASISATKAELTPTIISSPTITETPVSLKHKPIPEAEIFLEEAFSYSQQGEDEKAIETYTKAIEADPLFGQPYLNRGAIYADHRELEKALADFNKGLELDPTNALGYSNRAQIHIELNKLDNALEDIKSLINLAEDDEDIKRALTIGGQIYQLQDEHFLALAAYTAALKIDEFFTPALISRGQIYFNQGDWLRAFSDLVLAIQIEEDPDFRDALIEILMGIYPEGTTMDDAIKNSEPHFYKGMEFQNAGDYQSALESLSKAIEINPLNDEFYYQRGWNYTNFDEIDIEKAETDMSYVIALNPFGPAGYYSRGLFKAHQGLAAEAVADLEKAIELGLEPDAKAQVNQLLKDMRERLKTCQMTEFEVINDAEKPTFSFIFLGPPNESFSFFTNTPGERGGSSIHMGIIPEDGIALAGTEYTLQKGESTPIEVEITVMYEGCKLRKIAIWPEIDILAVLSGENP